VAPTVAAELIPTPAPPRQQAPQVVATTPPTAVAVAEAKDEATPESHQDVTAEPAAAVDDAHRGRGGEEAPPAPPVAAPDQVTGSNDGPSATSGPGRAVQPLRPVVRTTGPGAADPRDTGPGNGTGGPGNDDAVSGGDPSNRGSDQGDRNSNPGDRGGDQGDRGADHGDQGSAAPAQRDQAGHGGDNGGNGDNGDGGDRSGDQGFRPSGRSVAPITAPIRVAVGRLARAGTRHP
jgi:hypothetical protein